MKYLAQWLVHQCSINDACLSCRVESTVPRSVCDAREAEGEQLSELQGIQRRLPWEAGMWWERRSEEKRREKFRAEETAAPPDTWEASSGPIHCTAAKTIPHMPSCWAERLTFTWILEPTERGRHRVMCHTVVRTWERKRLGAGSLSSPAHALACACFLSCSHQTGTDSWGQEKAWENCAKECLPVAWRGF